MYDSSSSLAFGGTGGGGGVLPYMSYVGMCAVKGMIFSKFTLEQGIEIREFWSRIGYDFLQN